MKRGDLELCLIDGEWLISGYEYSEGWNGERGRAKVELKVHKIENFFGFDFEICTFS